MTDYQELLQRISKLEDAFNAHCQEKAMCSAQVQSLFTVVSRLDHTVYGNGKEGLTTIIARTDERLASVVECMNGLPDVFQEKIDNTIEKMRADAPKPEPLSAADKFVKWFSDRVLPYFVIGLFVVVLQAVWELIKIKVATP